jgi:NAD(P)H dehydrogenase (quinone)
MKLLVILGHPDPRSFNHAIASTVCETLGKSGHTVVFHDLCAEGFDPLLPKEEIPEDGLIAALMQKHCEELRSADGIVIVHPNWWGQPPAILKGWVDRIFRPGVAYRFEEGDSGEGVPKGLIKAKAAIVFNTSNTEAEREKNVFGDPLETIWRNCIFGLCGVKNFSRRVFSIMVTSTRVQREQWLDEVKSTINALFPRDAQPQTP